MLKGLSIYLLLAACLAAGQAAVLRSERLESTTAATTEAADSLELDSNSTEAAEDSTTTIATPTVISVAFSRDEEVSIQIGGASVDPAPGTVDGDLSVRLDQPYDGQNKSAKLLLLSTPPKRPIGFEQPLEEELEEQEAEGAGNITTTTAASTADETTEEFIQPTTEKGTEEITKLFAINETALAESPTSTPTPSIVLIPVTANNATETVSLAEQAQDAKSDNVAVSLALIESEAEYVLIEGADIVDEGHEVQLGSFTHIGSDEHLQPVVHSVEIVPTSFDDPLIVNYVHHFP